MSRWTMMPELRSVYVAAECPLTAVQVKNLAYMAAEEDGRPEFASWLYWSGPCVEVAEWLWQYWVENASDPDGDGPSSDLLRELSYRPGPRPDERSSATRTSASDAAERQTRGLSSVVPLPWRAESGLR